TLGQSAVEDKTNELPVAPQVLRGLLLEGRVVTMEALLTQRAVAQEVLDGGGDYVRVVKGNQPQLLQDLETVFSSPPPPTRSDPA
ncbi:MAG: ISAs1 family transposase, partial [Chloroflexi bacterium]|nr:ISAs1 family transposase [Chloroflexota bacterium]